MGEELDNRNSLVLEEEEGLFAQLLEDAESGDYREKTAEEEEGADGDFSGASTLLQRGRCCRCLLPLCRHPGLIQLSNRVGGTRSPMGDNRVHRDQSAATTNPPLP